jgi:hypothetical protein
MAIAFQKTSLLRKVFLGLQWDTWILLFIFLICNYVLGVLRDFPSLDVLFFYSVSDMNVLFSDLKEEGRELYFRQQFFDLAYIASYTLLGLKLLRHLFKIPPRWLFLLALVPGFFDSIETLGIQVLLKRWPDLGQSLPEIVRFATPLKWSSGGILLLAIVSKIFARRVQRVQN